MIKWQQETPFCLPRLQSSFIPTHHDMHSLVGDGGDRRAESKPHAVVRTQIVHGFRHLPKSADGRKHPRLVVGGVQLKRRQESEDRGRRLSQHASSNLLPILVRFQSNVHILKGRQRRQLGRGEHRREHATLGLHRPSLPVLPQPLVQEYGKGCKIQSFLDEVGQSAVQVGQTRVEVL